MKSIFERIRAAYESLMVRLGKVGFFESMLNQTSSHDDPGKLADWHMGWVFVHPVKWLKGLIYNHFTAFLLIAVIAGFSIAVISGCITMGEATGLFVLAFVAAIIVMVYKSNRDDDES